MWSWCSVLLLPLRIMKSTILKVDKPDWPWYSQPQQPLPCFMRYSRVILYHLDQETVSQHLPVTSWVAHAALSLQETSGCLRSSYKDLKLEGTHGNWVQHPAPHRTTKTSITWLRDQPDDPWTLTVSILISVAKSVTQRVKSGLV